jgi:hypothetical protein
MAFPPRWGEVLPLVLGLHGARRGGSRSEIGSLSLFPSVSGRKPFLIFPEIRNSDWAEILRGFFSEYSLSCGERRASTEVPTRHLGMARGVGRAHVTCGALEHRLALILPPKNHIYSIKNLREFLSRLDFVWYGISVKQKTCKKQELALGTGSIS